MGLSSHAKKFVFAGSTYIFIAAVAGQHKGHCASGGCGGGLRRSEFRRGRPREVRDVCGSRRFAGVPCQRSAPAAWCQCFQNPPLWPATVYGLSRHRRCSSASWSSSVAQRWANSSASEPSFAVVPSHNWFPTLGGLPCGLVGWVLSLLWKFREWHWHLPKF